ncbi:MAG: hypothetical protein A4E37_01280 [Methanoregulaceae archaeon PtaB.Bin056]|jgi:antitoxin YefM|nr:MAG: hypothetical protein A4E37_01280 [Methanoregulaceae archaeon PtaB.Bin056]
MSTDVTLQEIYREIKQIRKEMIRREDLDELVYTVELMSTPEKMEMIRKSEEDIRMGRVKEISTVEDLLNESSP